MIAHVTGLKPGDFIHTIGDAHVYLNHIEPLKQQVMTILDIDFTMNGNMIWFFLQISRTPRAFPSLQIKRTVDKIEDFTFDDFAIIGYEPHPTIKMEMAV